MVALTVRTVMITIWLSYDMVIIEVEVAAQTQDSFKHHSQLNKNNTLHSISSYARFPTGLHSLTVHFASIYANCMNFYAPPSHPAQGS